MENKPIAYLFVDNWNFKESIEGLYKNLQEMPQALITGWDLMQKRCLLSACINDCGKETGVLDRHFHFMEWTLCHNEGECGYQLLCC